MAANYDLASTTSSNYADLRNLERLEPKDAKARIVMQLVMESHKNLSLHGLSEEEALLNSLASSPDEVFTSNLAPYGTSLVTNYQRSRPFSRIISPFSAEQTNAITTKMSAPLLGQREVLYVEGSGDAESARKARVRERLWERAIRSPYTNWETLVWSTNRDVVVRSRGYFEVRHLLLEEERRVYQYGAFQTIRTLVQQGLGALLGRDLAGTIRTSRVEKVKLWDGPVLTPLLWGSVHKDPSEPMLTDQSKYVILVRDMIHADIQTQAKLMFPAGGEGVTIPFNDDLFEQAMKNGTIREKGMKRFMSDATYTRLNMMESADPLRPLSEMYQPAIVLEFRGMDPLEDPACRYVYWVLNGVCIGGKKHTGSGSVINVVELAWDPINGFNTSASPIMLLRRTQEQLNLLEASELDAVLWESHASGGVNMMAVSDIGQLEALRPGMWFPKMSNEPALEKIQVGQNSQIVRQSIDRKENSARLATAGIAAISGEAPSGAPTATAFEGISQGAITRIGIQQEINTAGWKRAFALALADWRDNIATDAELQEILGNAPDVAGAQLQDLDGEQEVVVLASRYHAVRQNEITAITAILDRAAMNPEYAARLKSEVWDDFTYGVAGPRGYRWTKTDRELQEEGYDPQQLHQQTVENANIQGQSGKGQPSPPAPPSNQPSGILGGGEGEGTMGGGA